MCRIIYGGYDVIDSPRLTTDSDLLIAKLLQNICEIMPTSVSFVSLFSLDQMKLKSVISFQIRFAL